MSRQRRLNSAFANATRKYSRTVPWVEPTAKFKPPPSVAKNIPLSVRRFRLLRADEEVLQRAIPFERLGQRRPPVFRQFVIPARRSLLALGDIVRLPARVA